MHKRFSWYRKICKPFRFSIFARFLIQAYLTLSICCLLQLRDPKVSSTQSAISISASLVVFSVCAVYPFAISLLAVGNKSRLCNPADEEFQGRWEALFYEFKTDGTVWQAQFYAVFLLRRMLLSILLVLLSDFPLLQGVLNLLLAFGV